MTQREIKFRAWNKRTNQFGRTATLVEALEFAHNDPEAVEELDYLEFMQYTGLKDKNTLTDIYEGDIIRFASGDWDDFWGNPVGDQWIGKIEFDSSGWLPFITLCGDGARRFYHGRCEVIGNIWENPDLLEGLK